LYGLEAINANNGWAISVVGVTIVFSGLVSLALVISRLYKVLELWENPSRIKAFFQPKQPEEQLETDISDIVVLTESQKEVAKQFALLARTMEDHFSLSRLLRLAVVSDLKDPYSNLNTLLKTKIIISDGLGFFTWNKDRLDKIIS